MFEAIKQGRKRSIRKIAEATGIAKSSVHRHQQAIERRNQYPESELWETAAGGQWLRLLVLGTIYIFGINCGIVQRGFWQHHLPVLTVIHNFGLKRADGTTAAQRLFSRQFPHLLPG